MTDAKPWAGLEELRARVRGTELRYFVGGSGDPPLVLVHGLAGAASNWVELAPLLARRHRLLVPDLPGHGGSEPLPAAPSLDVYADRLVELIEREGVAPAVVGGHSLGGPVVLRAAARRPDAVRAVALFAGAGITSSSRVARNWITLTVLTRPGRAVAPLARLVARRPLLRYAVFGWFEVADPPALSAAATEGFLVGPGQHTDVASAGFALARHDPRTALHGVRCPCLVVWGAEDHLVPVADGVEYARRLRAPLRVIPGCGHLLIGERPEACADALESWLDRIGELEELPREVEAAG